jgi:hypothetical protein
MQLVAGVGDRVVEVALVVRAAAFLRLAFCSGR